MNPADDMDAPVTRRELREELDHMERRLEQKLEHKFAHWANVIAESLRSHIAALDDKYGPLPVRMATFEAQYSDIPARVATLERKVFAPRPRAGGKRRPARRR